MVNYLKEVESILKSKGFRLIPCSESEISEIEQFYECTFPDAYLNFLSVMGRGAGGHFQGSDIFFDSIFDLKEWGKEFLEEHAIENFPENAFIFGMHQGYQIVYFLLDSSPNPEIVRISETEQEGILATKKYSSLNEFLSEGLM